MDLTDVNKILNERLEEIHAQQLERMKALQDLCARGFWCVRCHQPFEFYLIGDGAEIMPLFTYAAWCGCPIPVPQIQYSVKVVEAR